MIFTFLGLLFRIHSNLVSTEGGEISVLDLYELYKEETCFNNITPISAVTFGEVIHRTFQEVKKHRRRDGKILQNVYRGLSRKSQPPTSPPPFLPFNIRSLIPEHLSVSIQTDKVVIFMPTSNLVNGIEVMKKVAFHLNGEMDCFVGQKQLDLNKLGVSQTYNMTTITAILMSLDELHLCRGKIHDSCSSIQSRHIESWSTIGDENPTKRVRAKTCLRVVPITADSNICTKCSHMSFVRRTSTDLEEPEIKLDEEDSKDLSSILDQVIPSASSEFKALLLNQKKAHDIKDGRQMRWDKSVIRLCLSLYTRSPGTYKELHDSGFLKLPSGRLLSLHKNAVPQETGNAVKIC